jgi:hypothetical protein
MLYNEGIKFTEVKAESSLPLQQESTALLIKMAAAEEIQ